MLGAIADDFTGATDLATMLRRSGHRVTVVIEDGALSDEELCELDAVVIALKTRTEAPAAAVASSLKALARLRDWRASRYYVKYCSTFDSTAEGNIGPVLDAVCDALAVTQVVVVPSLPANGRTVYAGHLFVGSDLLENSSMRHHPLTPMTRSRVADVLRPQTSHPVAEIHHPTVRRGPDAIRHALDANTARYVVVDAIDDADLAAIGAATATDILVSGGSGLALGIPGPRHTDRAWSVPPSRRGVVLCGSVSEATRAQIKHAARTQPARLIDIEGAVADADVVVADLVAWVEAQDPAAIPIICAARDRSDVRAGVGQTDVAALVEGILATAARRLVEGGSVNALIVSGGETSGAVVRALGITSLHIGPELAPGVCWSAAHALGHTVALALKSGNFGREDLFTRAWEVLA